jgi:gliding motility-associated-like protein
MTYTWTTGDGNQTTLKDLNYSFTRPGTYPVKMIASSSSICADTSEVNITIYPNAVADFDLSNVCINLPLQLVNKTADTLGSPVNYVWNYGNGESGNGRQPNPPRFSRSGSFTVSLSVNTDQCPTPYHTIRKTVVVDRPRPGQVYPNKYAVIDMAQSLQARRFGTEVLWSPATYLSQTNSYTPVFKGAADQVYTVAITTSTGCVTIDTQSVRIVNKVEIFVPNAFTPNNDNKNDYLRPILFGIREVRYFKVYNRWGQMMYSQNGELPGWDGNFNGVTQTTQTVVWMVEGVGVDGKVYFRKGTAELIR